MRLKRHPKGMERNYWKQFVHQIIKRQAQLWMLLKSSDLFSIWNPKLVQVPVFCVVFVSQRKILEYTI